MLTLCLLQKKKSNNPKKQKSLSQPNGSISSEDTARAEASVVAQALVWSAGSKPPRWQLPDRALAPEALLQPEPWAACGAGRGQGWGRQGWEDSYA